MVHKKYIKRDGKTFGPYLYQNYRENGVTKTKYLGLAKERKKLRVNLLWIIGTIILILLLISSIGFFVVSDKEELKGELESKSPFDFLIKLFTTSSPVNVFVQIVSNLPPEFLTRPPEILVCENNDVNETLLVRDSAGDNLRVFFQHNLGIRLIFSPETFRASGNWDEVKLWTSGKLDFNDINERRNDNEGWAIYPENIYVEDGSLSDSFSTNLTIIEVNDAPEFDIGVQTIELYLRGENTNFYYELGSELISNGEETPKQYLNYSLTYQNGSISLFNISNLGVINITGNESYILSGNFTNYPLRICVNDTGLSGVGVNRILHSSISKCLEDSPPQSAEPLGWCDNFILTITKKNRAPNITSYYPLNISSHANTNENFNRSLKVSGNDILYFNLTAYDPDWTPLDVYWYVDNVSAGYYEGLGQNNVSKFEYFFGCGISGNYTIKAVVTDGLLNDFVQWNISVNYIECPMSAPGGGGGVGGGGGKLYCKEKWGCDEWMQCENLDELVKKKWLTKDVELLIKDRCNLLNYSVEFCGLQNRICTDFNYCKTGFEKLPFIKECYYTKNPNCTDGIQNCHNGSCEVLVDCGGSCEACPTCHDNIQNQNEERVDCGGPCRACIELPWLPVVFKSIVMYSLIALLIIILLLVARQIIKYTKFKRIFGESRIKNVLIRGEIRGEKRDENKNVASVVISLFFIFFVIVLLLFANTYILNLAQANKIISKIPSAGGAGLLASYGFMNSIFNNLGMFFVTGPITSWDNIAELTIGDDSDDENRFSGQDFYFYADYNYVSEGPITAGSCRIRFDSDSGYSDWEGMVFNETSTKFEYTNIFDYKGEYNFEVECSENGGFVEGSSPGFVRSTDKFIVSNTPPEFKAGTFQVTYRGFEDFSLIYNFTENVTDPDSNDELRFDFQSINLQPVSNYPWISLDSLTGIMIINSTINSEAQNFKVSVKVLDNDDVGELRDFYFNIAPVNDAPQFINLENKIFNEGDLFGYIINVQDEEWNIPFKFNISIISCVAPSNPACDLFKGNYSFDEINGKINISFIPANADIGSYIINFSVMDNSSLGNKTTSQLVNFTVTPALWKNTAQTDYLLTEDENQIINLSEQISDDYVGNVIFSYNLINSEFPSLNSSFNLTTGIINITPVDEDVGYNEVEIIASSLGVSSFRIFNFTVLNVNDNIFISNPSVNEKINQDIINNLNLSMYESIEGGGIYLYVRDDDFKIPFSQKSFYNEELIINLTIEGPNPNLFEFIESGPDYDTVTYSAEFDTFGSDVGDYNISVNVTDASNFSAILRFNLTVMSRDYDNPNITFPDESLEFNMKENVTSSDLIFKANHSAGDNLNYSFYIDDVLRDSFLGKGNDTNVSWLFAPNFTDETYENEIKNLTLIVRNPYYPDLFATKSWNLTINHTNAPPEFIRDIGDKSTTYINRIEIDLENHFTDIDYYDLHYNQSFIFNITSNANSTNIGWIKGDSDWKIILLPLSQRYTKETLNITMYDLNESGSIISNATSNNFIIEFTEPPIVQVPTPSGGSSETIPIALKIIMPGQISAYEGDTIKIPLKLVNSGSRDFNDVNLSSFAFKNSSLFNEIKTSLDKTYFKVLKPKQEENLTLTVFFNKSKLGRYEILVNATSKSPKYTDWGKIYIDLQAINESQVRELLVFTEELIAGNPQCVEITEILKEADKYLQAGDFANARIKANKALDSCRAAISQVSVPRVSIPDFIKSFKLGSYLFLAIMGTIVLAIILGLIYYFIKRREIAKLQKIAKESKEENTKV